MSTETYPPSPISNQPNSPFFQHLPRELRDKIYHEILHAFFHTHYNKTCFFSSSSLASPSWAREIKNLHRRYRFADWMPDPPASRSMPLATAVWLTACKRLMQEGVAQFFRGAVWSWRVRLMPRTQRVTLPVDAAVRRMELYVGYVSVFSAPLFRGNAENSRRASARLSGIARAMRDNGVGLDVLRFVGCVRSTESGGVGPACHKGAGEMMRNLVGLFDGVDVRRWELCVHTQPNRDYWVLFEWVVGDGERKDGELKVLGYEEAEKLDRRAGTGTAGPTHIVELWSQGKFLE
ncbi:hypothetical protein GQ44DRAFT_431191 [Phaeosphaeriaceae sp. PMI808]|nr:hypothetical protein GQ44DRAFT_431191 [Phaeosphaeriaceae sp. PMI808]